MVKIKIKDLPKDQKISPDEMKKVKGGIRSLTSPQIISTSSTISIGSQVAMGSGTGPFPPPIAIASGITTLPAMDTNTDSVKI
jgi:hypothetical protein